MAAIPVCKEIPIIRKDKPDKKIFRTFDRPIRKTYQAITKRNPMFQDVDDLKFNKEFTKIRNNVKDAFGGLTSLAAATIVGKRMLVPFIATPLAGKVEKKMNEREARKNGAPLPEENKDKSNPSMQGANKEVQTVSSQVSAVSFDTGSTNLLDKFKQQ
jgi:hypothetical protein